MMHLLTRLRGFFGRSRLKHGRRYAQRERSRGLFPALEVRMLEERRVFHAGAVAAPAAEVTQPPPPPPTTIVTLDASQNLMVQDASGVGQNDQLTLRLDAANGRFEISDPNHFLQTDIAGATGNGTHQVYVPLAAVGGDRVLVATGAGDDALAVDLTDGLAGKTLLYDGGAGHDGLTLFGGTYESVGYLFEGDGTTQILVGSGDGASLLQATGVEPIHDTLVAQARKFTLGVGVTGATLGDDGATANMQSNLTTSLGTSVTFVSPRSALVIQAAGGSVGATLDWHGLDARFAADLCLDAGMGGHIEAAVDVDLQGHNLTIHGDEIQLTGRIVTHDATIEIDAEFSLTVTAECVLDNASGRVHLDAGASGTLKFSGCIDVSDQRAAGTGGTVHLLGQQVEMLDGASIDASGSAGGGEVLVGGDYQGLNPLVRRATNTFLSADASITANALVSGNGGKIIVWADEAAIVAGSGNLAARGGPQGGNGGLIETSGKRYLYVDAAPNAAGPAGQAGTWLLDPRNVTINHSSAGAPAAEYVPNSDNTVIGDDTIVEAMEDNDTNVVIYTGTSGSQAGDITVLSSAVIKVTLGAAETRTLSLNAANDILIDAGAVIQATSGTLNVELHANTGVIAGKNDDPVLTAGNVTVEGTIATNGGSFTSSGKDFLITGSIATGDGLVEIDHTGDVLFNGGAVTGGDISITGNTITRNGSASADITTTDGEVSLTSVGTIGTFFVPLRVNTGSAGLVWATTSGVGGSIFLTSSDGIRIGELITSTGTHSIVVSTTNGADLTIAESSISDDQWLLSSDNDLCLEDGVGITADAFIFIAAEGSITGGSDPDLPPTIDFRQTDTSLDLLIVAGRVGTPDIPIIVDLDPNSAAAMLELRTEGDFYVLFAEGDPTPSRFVNGTITAPHSGVTIGLGTLDGNVTLADLPTITDPSSSSVSALYDLTDNGLHLEAHGAGASAGNINVNIVSDPLVYDPLVFTSVTLIADGTIYGFTNPSLGAAIDTTMTTASGGNITLQSSGPLCFIDEFGAAGGALAIRAGTGIVSAKTTGTLGHILLTSLGDLNLGVIETESTMPQFVSLSTTAAVQVTGSSDTEDVWEVFAEDDIDFDGGSIKAVSVKLESNAGDILSSGNAAIDIDTSPSGVITLDAAGIGTSSDSLIVVVGATGSLNILCPGDVYLDVAQGSFLSSQLVTLPTGNLFDLEVLSGSLVFDTVCDLSVVNDLRLAASANIESQGVGRLIGDLITLTAGGSVGASLGAPLVVTANNALSAVTATLGNIYVSSPQNLAVSEARASAAGKEISFKTTGTSNSLDVSVTSLEDDNWRLVSAGDLVLRVADNATGIQFSQLLEVSTTGARNVLIEATNGPIEVDDIRSGFNLNDDSVRLESGGDEDISFQATGKALQAAHLAFDAGGSIGSFADPFIINVSGTVTATATTGDIFIESVGPLNVVAVTAVGSNKDVSFVTTGADNALQVATTSLGDDAWHLVASGNIALSVSGAVSFDQIFDLQSTKAGGTVVVNALAGSLNVDALHDGSDPGILYGGVNVADDHVRLISSGDILSASSAILRSASLDLEAKFGAIGEQIVTPLTTVVHPFVFDSPVLRTRSFGSQWLDSRSPGGTRIGPASTISPSFDTTFIPGVTDFLTYLFGYITTTGTITLTHGTFYVDQSQALLPPSIFAAFPVISTSQLNVERGVTLGGSGAMFGTLKVKGGGTIDLGFAPTESGRLQVYGNVSFDSGSTLIADINPPYNLAGDDYDQLAVGGSLDLVGVTLKLQGADQLQITINPIKLIDVQNRAVKTPARGFNIDGVILTDQGTFIRAQIGQFRGRLLTDGGDGNDIVLSDLSLSPPIQNPDPSLPPLRLPIYTSSERPLPPVETPPAAIPATVPAPIEQKSEEVSVRYLVIRIVIPIDDAGNVREEEAMKLSAEWLERLPMVLRHLPDDHYRIYLVLDRGSEERLVIDVFVKGGRAVEPGEVQSDFSTGPLPSIEVHDESDQGNGAILPANEPGSAAGMPAPAALPSQELTSASLRSDTGLYSVNELGSARLLLGASAGVAAIVAGQSTRRWSDQVDEAAAVLGSDATARGLRWWRWTSHCADPSH